MRLIDADVLAVEMKARQEAAKKWVEETKDEDDSTYARACGAYSVFSEVKLTLDKMPTVDAVEVLRCKDCERRKDSHISKNPELKLCGFNHGFTYPDFFCKDGERRSE